MKKKLFCLLVALMTLAGFLPGALPNTSPPSALAATPPSVFTQNPGNVAATSVTLNGVVDSLGTAVSVNVSFQWGLSSGNYTSETPPLSLSTVGAFSANLTALIPGASYYFRAKAAGDGTSYGLEKSFFTPLRFLRQWGSSGSGNGQFNSPLGVAVDSAGNVYVADSGNHRIQKFTSSGQFITKWGASGSLDGQFNSPNGVAVDSAGNVYVADTFNNRIQKFLGSGQFVTT
ncbi:MAG: hypothetical protein AABZ77_01690, partial [Chloroflexota bacterium]